jgi:hypothetical protein
MQGGPDTLRHPIAFPERLAVAPSLDRPERHPTELESQPDPCADPNAVAQGIAQRITLELA